MASSVLGHDDSVFRVEGEAETFFRNAINHVGSYTVIQYRRQCNYVVVKNFNLLR